MAEGLRELENHRASIDRLDASILPLLSERLRVLQRALAWKEAKNRPLTPSGLRMEDIKGLASFADSQGLASVFVQSLFRLLYDTRPKPDHVNPLPDLDHTTEQDFRSSLKRLEQALILVLAERFEVVKSIGLLKARLGLPPLDQSRWQAMMDKKRLDADSLGLPWNMVLSLYESIHTEALRMESLSQG